MLTNMLFVPLGVAGALIGWFLGRALGSYIWVKRGLNRYPIVRVTGAEVVRSIGLNLILVGVVALLAYLEPRASGDWPAASVGWCLIGFVAKLGLELFEHSKTAKGISIALDGFDGQS